MIKLNELKRAEKKGRGRPRMTWVEVAKNDRIKR